MESTSYLRAITRYWWLVLIPAIAAMVLALVYSSVSETRYQTTASFIVSPNQVTITEQNSIINSLNALDRRSTIATFAEVLTSQRVRNQTAQSLQLELAALAPYEVTAAVLPEANVVELTVEGPDRRNVVALANAVGLHAVEYATGLYSIYTVDFLDEPVVPENPVSPQPVRDAAIAFVVGAGFGSLLATALDRKRNPGTSRSPRLPSEGREPAAGTVLPWTAFERYLQNMVQRRPGGVVSMGLVRMDGLDENSLRLSKARMQDVIMRAASQVRMELLPRDLVGQLDATTLAVLLPGISGQAAVEIFKQVYHRLSRPVQAGAESESVFLRPRIGVSELESGQDLHSLVGQARQALEQAGEAAGAREGEVESQVRLFTPTQTDGKRSTQPARKSIFTE